MDNKTTYFYLVGNAGKYQIQIPLVIVRLSSKLF